MADRLSTLRKSREGRAVRNQNQKKHCGSTSQTCGPGPFLEFPSVMGLYLGHRFPPMAQIVVMKLL
ncbi:uncharacterized protein G2W53_035987 [Senna tora]|uniref:Uncharacterized protein n=1 Tax=Senna tora TaxID=362788 RepID=A0A834SSQ1_9FABA|nr:uncharacterized protein G2W53_035987 [Senna tora]